MPKQRTPDSQTASEPRRPSAPASATWFRKALRTAPLAGLLAPALLIRAIAAAIHPNLIWPDEIYQTVEPAHHLVFGGWIRSWEWVVGMRSWLIPGLLAVPLWLGRMVDPAGPTGANLVTVLMIVLSLTPVVVGYFWGARQKGVAGGLFLGGVAAVWPDLIYMAPHPLADVFASHLFLAALYAAFPLTTRPSLRRLTVAGALLGLTLYVRMQLGPAAAVAMVLAAGLSPDRWRALLAGSGVALALLGVFDWVTLGTPFQSIWLNFWFNIVGKVSEEYGVEGPLFYVAALNVVWGPALLVALMAVLLSYRKHSALLIVFVVIIATQSLVGHKEWRFIFPALPILILLVGLGLLELLPRLAAIAALHGAPRWSGFVGIIAIAGGLSLAVATTSVTASFWSNRSSMLQAFDSLRRQPDVCGIGLLVEPGRGAGRSWVAGPGSTALARGTLLYIASPDGGWKTSASYNAAVIEEGDTPPPPFRRIHCAEPGTGNPAVPGARTCVWRRPGGCNPAAGQPLPLNWPGFFLDERGNVRRDRLQPSIFGLSPPLRSVTQDFNSATSP